MSSRKKWFLGLALFLLGLALFAGTRPQECAGAACKDRQPDALTYGVPGKHPVGRIVPSGPSSPSMPRPPEQYPPTILSKLSGNTPSTVR